MKSTITIKGNECKVISQVVVIGYSHETNREMKKRYKLGIPINTYSYVAIKTERIK